MASASKEYQLAVKIAGSVSGSFKNAMATAEGRIDSFSSAARKAAGLIAAAWGALQIGEFITDSVQAAVDFESCMADIAKVVDGLRDENGNLTDSYYAMSDSIIDMSKNIPMAADELAAITAAAGTAGIAMEELGIFTETAAKMGVAFDITAEQAGDWMAKWRTSFSMTQEEVTALADQINYLSNNSAATASEISTVVTAVGPLGDVAGMTAAQIAALGSTMVGVGVQQDVAATGIKKLATVMVAGESATKAQQAVLKQLGFDATELAVRMQTDAEGAILSFLEAVKRLPEAEQAAALKNYFGQESIGAIAPLLTNLDVLRQRFEMVGDAQQYAGSMEAEYAARAATTANNIQLYENRIAALKIQLGTYLLPILNTVLGYASDGLDWLGEKLEGAEGKFSGLTEKVKVMASVFVNEGIPKIRSFVDGALGLFEKVKPSLETIITKAGEIFSFVATTAGEAIAGVAGKIREHQDIVDKFAEIASRAGEAIMKGFEAAKPVIEYIGTTAIPAIADAILTVIDAVATVVLSIRDFKTELAAAAAVYAAFKVSQGIQSIVGGFQQAKLQLYLFTQASNNANIAQAAMNGTLKLGEVLVALLTGKVTLLQLAQAAWATVTGVCSKAFTALNAVLIANPIIFVVTVIAALIAILVVLYKKCDWFRKGVDKIFAAVKKAFASIGPAVKNMADGAKKALAAMKENVSEKFEDMKEVMGKCMKAAQEVVSDRLKNMRDAYESNGGGMKGAVSAAMEAIKGYYTAGYSFIDKLTNGKLSDIVSYFRDKLTDAASVVQQKLEAIKNWFSSKLDAVKTTVNNAITAVKNFFSSGLQSAYNTVSSILNNIKNKFSSIMDSAKTTVSNAVTAIKNFFNFKWSLPALGTSILETAKNTVSKAVSYIKGLFNFSWSLPKIKTPHFYISGYTKVLGVSIPSIGVSWYKNGGILDGAQIFGAAGGNLLGGGEAGKEAVLPLSQLWKQMRSIMGEYLAPNNSDAIGGVLRDLTDKMRLAGSSGDSALAKALNALLGEPGPAPQPALVGGPNPAHQIVYSPTYQFYGEAPSKDDLVEASRMSQEEFNAMMDEYFKDHNRKDF